MGTNHAVARVNGKISRIRADIAGNRTDCARGATSARFPATSRIVDLPVKIIILAVASFWPSMLTTDARNTCIQALRIPVVAGQAGWFLAATLNAGRVVGAWIVVDTI
jgi:hypothetical protein